jgi:GMP synthase-like glutamine amidotransferase
MAASDLRGSAGRPRVLLIEHERMTPAGLVNDWLDAHRAEVHLLQIDQGAKPEAPWAYDLIVSLGSESAAYDDRLPWIGRELELLGAAVAADVPVLGICFGGQLLARTLGAQVSRAPEPEIGWGAVRSDCPDLIAPGPWFQWHFDSFTCPAGATLLARNDAGPQAFVHGRSLGLQFHPEVDLEILASWVAVYREELDRHGVDAEALLRHTTAIGEQAREVSWRLLDGFYERILR